MPSDPKRPWYRVAEVVLTPILRAALRHRWRGQENLPLSGGVIVVANHISKIDPLTFGYFVNSAGRVPRYLAKASLFEHRWLGRVFIGTDMIPVQRGGEGAASSVQAAVDAVRGGSCVVVYPEATITRDPGLWPMVGKTGAARIALVTGAPVIPVAQWGAHRVLPPYAKRPVLHGRQIMYARAGGPVDLEDLRGREPDAEVLAAATTRIMNAITAELEIIRGEQAPVERFDPRAAGIAEYGNPHRGADGVLRRLRPEPPMRIAVMGAGSWGTAMALVLADAGNEVALWARRAELADAMVDKRCNVDHLPTAELPAAIRPTADAAQALRGAELVFLGLPAQSVREHLTRWTPALASDAVLVSLAKGVEQATTARMSEVIAQVTGFGPDRIAVLTGPNLAAEVAARQPAATVVACASIEVAERIQEACHTEWFRPYTITDVVGAELGGAVKNVIALAVGMAHGMGLGDNAKAALMTRGIAEAARLGVVLGADPYTLAGLAGVGDLMATCQSPLSRNRRFGERLGAGEPLVEVAAEGRQVVEGVATCQALSDLAARNEVDMPIVTHVTAAVRDGVPPAQVLRRLMSRSAKPERYGQGMA